MKICEHNLCVGCGMCSNICSVNAIQMRIGENGFVYPVVNVDRCVSCGLCKKSCPVNNKPVLEDTTKNVYVCWNRNKKIRKNSTSGGVFDLIAKKIMEQNGVVVGVKWNEKLETVHAVIEKESDLFAIRGSKYVQSDTGEIYKQVKKYLDDRRKVLFSGTPCQCHALKLFLKKDYENLFVIDVVCHGVPSQEMLNKYINEMTKDTGKVVSGINMRYKAPYWDYCNMQINFGDGSEYSVPTVDDPFFTLFNIGYSLRNSCHTCQYTNFKRVSDITLMDFWGFIPRNFRMRDYNKGVSGMLINSYNGKRMFEQIASDLIYEESTKEAALKANKSLAESYWLEEDLLNCFWSDYKKGVSIRKLRDTYVKEPFVIPKNIFWRRLKKKYRWLVKK